MTRPLSALFACALLAGCYGTADLPGEEEVLPPGPGREPPPAVTEVVATAIDDKHVTLAWKDNAEDEDHFRVDQAASADGPFKTVATLDANSIGYGFDTLVEKTTYYFRVVVLRARVESAAVIVTVTTPAYVDTSIPMVPTAVMTAPQSPTSVKVDWTAAVPGKTGDVAGYLVLLNGQVTQMLTGNVTTYTDVNLAAGVQYCYTIKAYSTVGTASPESEKSCATTPAPNLPPADPAGVKAVANSNSQITVTWSDNSANETGFRVERATAASGPFTEFRQLGPNITSTVDTGLMPTTAYFYRVRALNANGSSGYSDIGNTTTPE